MRKYTVVYCIRHDAPACYHHLAHVTATDPMAAEARCKADTLPDFSYQTLIIFEGHLMALDVGDHVMHHSFRSEDL